MAYGYGRRRTRRTSTRRGYGRRSYAGRSRFRRAYSTRYGRPVRRRRRSYSRSRGGQRTIRVVVQTVAASPMSLGMKGVQSVRRMF